MELVNPSMTYEQSFCEALKEFDERGTKGFWNHRGPIADVRAYIMRTLQNSEGKDLPDGAVPSSTFWLIDDGVFVAHVNIRHILNDALKQVGGHIGYAVRPSRQKMGYGSHILALALPKAQALGIRRALVTCSPDNAASRKIIEKNGGKFHAQVEVKGEPVLQFWIDLSTIPPS